MVENPYQSPRANVEVVGINSGNVADLRRVAKDQKGLLVCILIQLCLMFGQLALPAELRLPAAVVLMVAGIAGTVFVFRLAMNVYSTGLGIALGILALIPCIGLIVLLAVNGKATAVLNQNGLKVGLLGVKLSEL